MAKGYRKAGAWHDQDRFACTVCPFDTLDEAAMVAHVEAHRAAEEAANRPKTLGVLGPDGKPAVVPAPEPPANNLDAVAAGETAQLETAKAPNKTSKAKE